MKEGQEQQQQQQGPGKKRRKKEKHDIEYWTIDPHDTWII